MKVLEGYGLTEGTTASSVNPVSGERKVGSIGIRLPYNDMKVFVPGDEGPREADIDEIGTICIKGPNVFKGYLDESKNKDIWMKDGWFNTGDLGRKDADEFFWLTGRAKDLIIRGGHNIDPAMIEEPLYQLEGVQVAAAVGRPDPHAGEVPVAFVQLQQGVEMSPDQIIKHLQEKIGERAAIPKEVFVLEDIPLTPIGKIFKPALRRTAIQYVYEKELNALEGIVASASVNVREDKLHGSFAEIRVKTAPGISKEAAEKKIKEVLARYIIKFDLDLN